MQEAELMEFYNNDKMEYNVKLNQDFLLWYDEIIDTGYVPYLNMNEIQSFINKLTYWYEFKFPDNSLNDNLKNMDLLKVFNIEALKYRLTDKELKLFNCDYSKNNFKLKLDDGRSQDVLIEDRYVDVKKMDFITEYIDINKEKISVNDLYKKLIFYNLNSLDNRISFEDLDNIINNHNIDLILRDKIFNLVTKSLVYSKNSNPDNGLFRSHKFMNEINNYFEYDCSIVDCHDVDKLVNNEVVYENIIDKESDESFLVNDDSSVEFIELEEFSHKKNSKLKRKIKSIVRK